MSKLIKLRHKTESFGTCKPFMGASHIDKILNKSKYGNIYTAYVYWFAKQLGYKTPTNENMMHGLVIEEEVEALIKNNGGIDGFPLTNCAVFGAVWQDLSISNMLIAQCDIFDPFNKTLIEIKCPTPKYNKLTRKVDYANFDMDVYVDLYKYQLAGQMAITGATKCCFAIYQKDWNNENNKLIYRVVNRDEALIKESLDAMDEFKKLITEKAFHNRIDVVDSIRSAEQLVKHTKQFDKLNTKLIEEN